MTGDGDMFEPDRFREWDASYVLGALSPQDRREYEQHLATCAACREAVADLAGMPGLLGLLPADEAIRLDESARQEESRRQDELSASAPVVELAAVARAAERRRTRSRLVLAAAAVLLLVAGVGGGVALAQRDAAPVVVVAGRTVELAPVGGSAVEASLTMTARGWGTTLSWHCSYPPHESWATPVVYTLVVVDSSGARTVAATWSAGAGTAKGLTASTSVPTDRIARLEIGVVGSDAPLAGVTV
ncbi:anti-sigma factor family protein [Cellulomonas edaphi]|uniref:Zf-HC2 domain-containing protein n=1 Tax=Cellulomonas edaphi TaxID=3053468 RepID=A0ABT7S6Q8_9CELL|nr:zf-HC2 domain-containing protein [Cellulomons edaphi]MDM7831303.1 zf-HC2 domain-containing protein [Cellulomons edaphi]